KAVSGPDGPEDRNHARGSGEVDEQRVPAGLQRGARGLKGLLRSGMPVEDVQAHGEVKRPRPGQGIDADGDMMEGGIADVPRVPSLPGQFDQVLDALEPDDVIAFLGQAKRQSPDPRGDVEDVSRPTIRPGRKRPRGVADNLFEQRPIGGDGGHDVFGGEAIPDGQAVLESPTDSLLHDSPLPDRVSNGCRDTGRLLVGSTPFGRLWRRSPGTNRSARARPSSRRSALSTFDRPQGP